MVTSSSVMAAAAFGFLTAAHDGPRKPNVSIPVGAAFESIIGPQPYF
jgi:hypothetical protein